MDPVTITTIGTRDGRSYKLSAVVNPGTPGCGSNTQISITGTTYYVRTTGSDMSDGLSAATAWRTIDYASVNIVARDGVYVGADGARFEGEYVNGVPQEEQESEI